MTLTAQIFGLSTLVSSFQIYNVDKRIQEDNLQHLALFSEYGRMALLPQKVCWYFQNNQMNTCVSYTILSCTSSTATNIISIIIVASPFWRTVNKFREWKLILYEEVKRFLLRCRGRGLNWNHIHNKSWSGLAWWCILVSSHCFLYWEIMWVAKLAACNMRGNWSWLAVISLLLCVGFCRW